MLCEIIDEKQKNNQIICVIIVIFLVNKSGKSKISGDSLITLIMTLVVL